MKSPSIVDNQYWGSFKACELPGSVFSYPSQALQKPDSYAREKVLISQIFHEHKGRYGYRRIMFRHVAKPHESSTPDDKIISKIDGSI
ncbi:hypothetical protein GCM10007941_10090 [Amphritea balenae]|nr:hypothetical protein GCM10007941_10090 [Amphritea balenae]